MPENLLKMQLVPHSPLCAVRYKLPSGYTGWDERTSTHVLLS